LDPSIRQKIQKRGVSIIQNVYTGFDTEYKNINVKENQLLSVQLAINTKSVLKIPRVTPYEISTMDTLSNKTFKAPKIGSQLFNFTLVENSLNKSINEIRLLKYKRNDESLSILVEGLKAYQIDHIEKDDAYVFSLPRTPIQPYIYFNKGKGFSLEDIVVQSNVMGEPYLRETYDGLIALLQRISKNIDFKEKEESVDLKLIEGKGGDILNAIETYESPEVPL
jgi:hypothetical protein